MSRRKDIDSDQAKLTRGADRRTSQRTSVTLHADVTLPGDLTIVSHTLDISSTGISLEVPYQLEIGQHCTIELNLSRYHGPKWVELTAVVRNCTATGESQFRAGMQFIDLEPALADIIETISSG